MKHDDLMQELLYRDIGRELTQQSQVVDVEYAMRAAGAMDEIYQALCKEHVDSRTRVHTIQSIMMRHGVFCPKPKGNNAMLLETLLAKQAEPQHAPVLDVPAKPKRGRPRKNPG